MGEKRIHIAYLTADWNRELVSVALGAVLKFQEIHKDVYVHVFDCFSFALYSGREGSGYQIYDLPDLRRYDAVLIQAHQIMDTEAIRKLELRLREARVPAISVGAKMEGCTFIGTDDYSAARELTEHVVKAHGARTFMFLKGCERDDGRGEAELRREAFEDVCRENGIPEENISYFEGGWESRRGRIAAEELLASGKPLPDAIVSANDEMALGALGGLIDAGIKVPQDVIVTGFDGILSASLSDPGLTTISRNFDTLITTALETLLARISGEDVSRRIFSPYKIICSESCGCSENALGSLKKIKRMYYENARLQERLYFQQDTMTADLFRADSNMILETMENHYRIFGEGRLYLFANDYYYDLYKGKESNHDLEGRSYSDSLLMVGCGGRDDAVRREDGTYLRISRHELIEAPLLRDERLLICYALHFKNVNMGFLALTQPPSVVEMHLHENMVNLCVFAMENARHRIRSHELNQKLNALYMQDQMTGLYNRFGYDRLAGGLFDDINDRGGDVHVLFLDIDDMKEINDRYGHDKGDLAIRTVSKVMNGSCRKSDFKMRYGGDEFVIITEAGKVDLKGRLTENFRRINESGELPFYLGVSIGDYTVKGKNPETLDELLRHADELMYREKSRKKRVKK